MVSVEIVMSRRRRRNSSDDVLIINDDSASASTFVDLTEDSPIGASSAGQSGRASRVFATPAAAVSEIVDLTCSDASPVVLEPVNPPGRRRRRQPQRATRASRRHSPYANDIIIDSDEENDVQVLSPVDVNNTLPWPDLTADTPPSSAAVDTPSRKQVKCPVCMDNESQIRAGGLQLTSTVCGHIFCNRCIRGAIQSQHRCPTCRHKLTIRQIHPIFL